MKILPVLLFIFYLNEAYSQSLAENLKYYRAEIIPRKYQRLLVSRKYLNGIPYLRWNALNEIPYELKLPISTKKKSYRHSGYTVFPAIASNERKLYDVPSSLYFPQDPGYSQNSIRNFHEDYILRQSRKKRSAVEDEPIIETRKSGGGKKRKEERKRQRKRAGAKKTGPKRVRAKRIGPKRAAAKRTGPKVNKKVDDDPTPASWVGSIRRVFSVDNSSDTELYKRSRRLIAAQDAQIEDYPYVVSIQKNGEHWCAGALLNPTMVITTANCLWKSNRLSRLKVRVGSAHSDRGGRLMRIQEVMKHPGWSIRKNPDNDVALMLLEKRLVFSDKLHGVDLPNRIMMPPFEDAWVTSWGAERRDGVVDKKAVSLQMYHANLMDRVACNNVTQRFGVSVTDNFICLTQTGRRAPCTRDTGAPAVSDGVLWGLASWGIRKLCGTERFPAMFSYLASQSNMDFISNATRFLMADERINPFLDRFPTTTHDEKKADPSAAGRFPYLK